MVVYAVTYQLDRVRERIALKLEWRAINERHGDDIAGLCTGSPAMSAGGGYRSSTPPVVSRK